ncbi:hypothetical protein [Paenibacillus daejeonensis]|uniref:hypothetical protein n=1 Tax=Paenibacillus daejeonensis TaxID=135193 RepID=UPI00036EEFDF|nr:hypothetical protein [Paenibacillus daejeonensis]
MNWLQEETAQTWREEGKRYAGDVNEYVRIGMETDWELEEQIEDDARPPLAHKAVKMIVAANEAGEVDKLREYLPPATWPLTEAFKDETQSIKPLFVWPNGEVLVRTGASWEPNTLVIAGEERARKLSGIAMAGGSNDGVYLAVSEGSGIRVLKQPDTTLAGEEVFSLTWETFRSQVQEQLGDVTSLANEEEPEGRMEQLIPFDHGQQVLLVSMQGIYQLRANGQVLVLYPSQESMQKWKLDEVHVDMVHGAVSPDGRWLAYGGQDSDHLLEDWEQGVRHEYEPQSSYPHFSLFSADGSHVWFNACHFYNGDTITIPLAEADSLAGEDEQTVVNHEMRVYAGVAYGDGCILGDAYGYLRYLSNEGTEHWRYFVGGTLSGLHLSIDGRELHVGTYAGMLHRIDLTNSKRSDYEIGTGTIRETGRWLLWKNYEPLRW